MLKRTIAAGLVATCVHPRLGRLEQVGSFWDMGDASQPLDRAAPELAQHTTEVLTEVVRPRLLDGCMNPIMHRTQGEMHAEQIVAKL